MGFRLPLPPPFPVIGRTQCSQNPIGNIVIGTIYKINGKWAAVSYYENKYGNVNGFATRMDAAQYLLQVFRVHKKQNKL